MPRRSFTWPAWICGAIDGRRGHVCGLTARWQKLPTSRSRTPWLYCERHKPAGADPIPPDAPFYVTRIELRVALTGAPGDRDMAADEAVRRIQCAIEGAGGVILGLKVPGGKASSALAEGPPLRLLFAEQGWWPPPASPFLEAPNAPAVPFWPRRRRRA